MISSNVLVFWCNLSNRGQSRWVLKKRLRICRMSSFSLKAQVQILSGKQVSQKLYNEQCLGARQERTFLFVYINLVIECELPLDASARVSLWKIYAFSEYFLLSQIYSGKLLPKRMQSEGKLKAPHTELVNKSGQRLGTSWCLKCP